MSSPVAYNFDRWIALKKSILLIILSLLFILPINNYKALAYSASAYCLYDPVLKKVLTSSNMNEKKAMASTTKIMTAFIACEICDLEKEVEIKPEMIAVEGSSIGLQVGDKISIRCLLYGLMLESGNDAALSLAVSISGSAKNFAVLMNQKAKNLGLKNTNFVTPNGLDDKNHYSCAYDMAKLSGFAMQNELFRKIVATKTYLAVYNNGETKITYYNHNKLLSLLDGADGIKTGFTKKAGRCLVSSCNRNGVRLIAVTLKAYDDWNDHKVLYRYGFKQYQEIDLPEYNKFISLLGGKKDRVQVESENKKIYFYKGLSSYIKKKVYLPNFIYAPTNINKPIGYVEYYYNNFLIAKCNIFAKENIKEKLQKKKEINFFNIFTQMFKYI